ncbi:MAG: phytoene/squalene synthase family protein [Actinobacteria bacterium]|jgi:phytoene synthase|nr:phytoene/squalene synthase family protein [Actinomycetota bacterium]NCU89139.1 phytoene/squalene synthase family protein [Actinomycetota bacterium]NDA95979.1 phytoene/squalene synthase family protein [Actinomycetota bacterium]NDE53096.1 phytoene/squalene synthase family protein [Actinomycetota bacterium]
MDELTAAGITQPALRESYKECKRLNSLHGKTYYLATLLLPKAKRPHVHALYGFARYADEIVDDLGSTLSAKEKRDSLERWSEQLLQDIAHGRSNDHIGRALVDTVRRFDIPIAYFEAFLHSMSMDLSVAEYETYEDLMEYVYGSAAVIGLQMVHVLGTVEGKKSEALIPAEKLGIAFQLANFIRDVGEDLERGRVYLPMSELRAHGVTRAMLENRTLTPQIIEALKFQIARVRALQTEANAGINLLSPDARPCIRAASELYCGIVDEVEKIDYNIFDKRAKTSTLRRASVAFPAWIQALAAR